MPGIVRLVEPYVSGAVEMFGERPGGANLAGLIWGQELAEATSDRRYADLILDVANRYRPGVDGGAPPPCDPDFRTEDMFMASAMLGRAFGITGERRYLDLLVNFLINSRIQQESGLFWHCRSAPFYWGRGNGFAALGLTETLSFLPGDFPGREAVLAMYRNLLDGLVRIQNPSGMLPQVLNVPGSYQEFTATLCWLCNGPWPAPRLAGSLLPDAVEFGVARSFPAHRRRGKRGGWLCQHRGPGNAGGIPGPAGHLWVRRSQRRHGLVVRLGDGTTPRPKIMTLHWTA